jgi:hypothetical protein
MKLKQKKCRDFLNATFLEMSKLQTQGKPGAMLYWPLRAKDLPSGNLRMLPKKVIGLCASQESLLFGMRTWQHAFVRSVSQFWPPQRRALLTAKYGHPSDFLVFRNP